MQATQPVTDTKVRCWRCGRFLADLVTRPLCIFCPKCRARNEAGNGTPTPLS